MLIRIVKMKFKADKVSDFISLFDSHKALIRGFQGCEHLELLRDTDEGSVFFTYSYWGSAQDLDNYRQSPLFEQVWRQTKALFDDKPQAWSVERLVVMG